jgi:hypothetical protein
MRFRPPRGAINRQCDAYLTMIFLLPRECLNVPWYAGTMKPNVLCCGRTMARSIAGLQMDVPGYTGTMNLNVPWYGRTMA